MEGGSLVEGGSLMEGESLTQGRGKLLMLRLLFQKPLLRKGSLGQHRKCGEFPCSAGDKDRIALSISFFLYAFLNFKAYVNSPGLPRA